MLEGTRDGVRSREDERKSSERDGRRSGEEKVKKAKRKTLLHLFFTVSLSSRFSLSSGEGDCAFARSLLSLLLAHQLFLPLVDQQTEPEVREKERKNDEQR